MFTYGIFYEFWQKDWGADYRRYIEKVARLGFDYLEVGAGDLVSMTGKQLQELRAMAEYNGIRLSANIGPAKEFDVGSRDPEVRQRGISYLCRIMDQMQILGCDKIVGVQYSYWPYDFQDLDKEALWERSVKSVEQLGHHAQDLGIIISLEVVNRFETILLNTAEEGVRFCKEVNLPNVKLLLDTFHMNIEEDDIPSAIRLAGDYLGHLHVGENNRKLPGQGISVMDWKTIGQALKEIHFNETVVMEPFITAGGSIARDIKVWRDLGGNTSEENLDKMAKQALEYLKEKFT